MTISINELDDRIVNIAEKVVEVGNNLEDLTTKVEELTYRLVAAEKALHTLSNTLHVIDATSLLSLYSLIKTDNLRQPTFTNNQDIIDSGCSDAINRMMKTVMQVNANERGAEAKDKNGKDETEGR